MFEVWMVAALLLVLIGIGILPLQHVLCTRHSSRDLTSLIPLSTLCVIGLLCIVHHGSIYFYIESPLRAIQPNDLNDSYFHVKLLLLVYLWRSASLSDLDPHQVSRTFTYFVGSFLTTLLLWQTIPLDLKWTASLSSQEPGVFREAPMIGFIVQLCLEYLIFYMPLFISLHAYHKSRSMPQRKSENTGIIEFPEACPRCSTISPFHDLVTTCLAVLLFVIRPAHILYYMWSVGVFADIQYHFYIIPFYTAMCFMNINCLRRETMEYRPVRHLAKVYAG